MVFQIMILFLVMFGMYFGSISLGMTFINDIFIGKIMTIISKTIT